MTQSDTWHLISSPAQLRELSDCTLTHITTSSNRQDIVPEMLCDFLGSRVKERQRASSAHPWPHLDGPHKRL